MWWILAQFLLKKHNFKIMSIHNNFSFQRDTNWILHQILTLRLEKYENCLTFTVKHVKLRASLLFYPFRSLSVGTPQLYFRRNNVTPLKLCLCTRWITFDYYQIVDLLFITKLVVKTTSSCRKQIKSGESSFRFLLDFGKYLSLDP